MPSRALIAAAFVSMTAVASALAQSPCDLVIKGASAVMGVTAGETERLTPVANAEVCTVRSADGAAQVSLTVESGRPAGQRLAMAKMIAKASKDVGQFRDEPGLGADAFSLRESDKVFFSFGSGTRACSFQLGKDRGVTDADVERARQFAKQLFAAK